MPEDNTPPPSTIMEEPYESRREETDIIGTSNGTALSAESGESRHEAPEEIQEIDEETQAPVLVEEEPAAAVPSAAEDPSVVLVTGEVVDEEQQNRNFQERFNQIIRTAPMIVVIPENDVHRTLPFSSFSRNQWIGITCALLLAMATIGILLGVLLPGKEETNMDIPQEPTTTSIPKEHSDLYALLSSVSLDGGQALLNESTSQHRSFDWLASNTNFDSYSDEKKIQHYALATLYYSTNGDNWSNSSGWLSNNDECIDWYYHAEEPVCSGDSSTLIELNLWSNNLNGSIT